jgi:hypothetical protein
MTMVTVVIVAVTVGMIVGVTMEIVMVVVVPMVRAVIVAVCGHPGSGAPQRWFQKIGYSAFARQPSRVVLPPAAIRDKRRP